MTENEKINEIIKEFADGNMNINSFVNKIYRLGFEDGKALHIADVVRSYSEIEQRIKKLNNKVEQLLIDYVNSDEKEQIIIAEHRISIQEQINQLKWVIGKS